MLLPIAALVASAQPQITLPEESQAASVSQTIGLTAMTITYHVPRVKGRRIWGGLVPYGEVWRCGANENTTVSFSSDVRVQGKDLRAGTYGLHMIPGETEWTVIFSTNAESWGSFFYDEKEDALRVRVAPVPAPFQEWLSYRFADPTEDAVRIELAWEKLAVPIRIAVDVPRVVLQHIRTELRGLAAFSWQPYSQAAAYCAQRDTDLEEGMRWIDRSIAMNPNFTNLTVKADLLERTGKHADADELRSRAIQTANERELNAYGYRLLGMQRVREAIDVFRTNVDRHPDSWNVYDSLGEAYDRKGETALAIEFYSKALDKVADETQKKRITATLNTLRSKSSGGN